MQHTNTDTLIALATRIAQREVSVVDTVATCLETIATHNVSINAIVTLNADAALARAAEADRKLSNANRNNTNRTTSSPVPLLGIPLTLKDLIDYQGLPCTAGVPGREHYMPVTSATVATRLEDAGAIVIGKTNVPDLGDAIETDNLLFGRTCNPYNLEHTPGGSSGGEASAIAAGFSVGGIGTDSGGSIRLPAHFCGVAGIKPTYGRVSRAGLFPSPTGFLHERNQPGPMARSIHDVALMLSVISGPDGIDPTVVPRTDPLLTRESVAGLRIAVFNDNGVVQPCHDTLRAIDNAASALSDAGAQIIESVPPGIEETAELMFCHRPQTDARTEYFQQLTGGRVSQLVSDSADAARKYAQAMDAAGFFAYNEKLNKFRYRMFGFMREVDAIVCPVFPTPAPRHGALSKAPAVLGISYTQTFNLCGWPSATVPVYWNDSGLPVGVQISAKPWDDCVTLDVGAALEQRYGFRAPSLSSSGQGNIAP